MGPNGESIAELARAHTTVALDALVEVCNDREHPQRVQAANAILDRGWGKPKESVDIDANLTGAGVPVIQIVRYAQGDGDNAPG